MGSDFRRRSGDGGTPSAIRRIEFDLEWPPHHAAAYLVDGPEPILIDAGMPGDGPGTALESALDRAGYRLDDVAHVVVTHPHYDHVGQVSLLRASGATVHAPRAAIDRLDRDAAAIEPPVRDVVRSVGYQGRDFAVAVDTMLDSQARLRRLLDPSSTRPIDPDEPFTVGGVRFRPIETPGHDVHHLSFEATIDEDPVLFSGDVLFDSFRAGAFHVGLDRGAYDAVDAFYGSMDRLEDTAATRVYPGHGPVFEDPQRSIRTTRELLDSLLAETLSALDAVEPATPLAVTKRRTGTEQRVDALRYFAAVVDTVGALGTLESRGEVTYDVDDGVRHYRLT